MPAQAKAAITAVGADLLIAAAKLTAFLFTRSSSMLSESIHSLVDAGNGSLLVFGLHRARRPADETHPFGYGKEIYFWTLLVALFIFLIGGGSSIYEGLHRLHHPEPLKNPVWNYITLALAGCFEGYSLLVGIREFCAAEGVPVSLRAVHASKNPETFTVVLEDIAALIGLVLAAIGNLCGQIFGWVNADSIASLLIGVVLLVVAFILILESRALLIGEGVNIDQLRSIRELALAQPGIESVGYPMTMYFGPDDILLTMNVRFDEQLGRDDIEQAVDRVESIIRSRYPKVRHIYLEAESLQRNLRFDPARLPRAPAIRR